MTTEEIIVKLRMMARYPTVTLPRDTEALKRAADLLQALEQQPADEPVAWGIANTRPTERNPLMMVMLDEPAPSHLVVPLYTRPQPAEPVAFKIYKPTPPRGATPNVRDAELPWVYDQDPSSGNVASMWVTPVKAAPPQPVIDESAAMLKAREA